jgi:hypothetical protein
MFTKAVRAYEKEEIEMSTKDAMGGVAVEELPSQTSHQTPQKKGADEKRLSLILSSSVFEDLSAMAKKRRTTMTEIVRLALGLVKVAIHEAEQGHKLVVAKSNGEVLKELVLPG